MDRKKYLLTIISIFVCYTVFLGNIILAEDVADKLIVIRKIMSDRGEWDLAENQLNIFLKENAKSKLAPEALLLLGFCQDKQRKDQEAVVTYDKLLNDYPLADNMILANACLGIADANFRLAKYLDAAKYYSLLLKKYPESKRIESALLWLGESYYRQARENEDSGFEIGKKALAIFSDYIKKYPQSKNIAHAIAGAGFTCFEIEEYGKAIIFLDKLLNDFPQDKRTEEARYYIAEAFYRLKDYEKAKENFIEFTQSHQESELRAEGQAGIAWCDYNLGNLDDAAKGFEKAAQLASNNAQGLSYYYDAGCVLREAGESQKAAEFFQKVAKNPEHELSALAWFRLGTLWQEQINTLRNKTNSLPEGAIKDKSLAMQKNMAKDAAKYFQKALDSNKLGNEDKEAYGLLAEALLDAWEYDEAINVLKELAVKYPKSDNAAWAYYHQALALREKANLDRGKEKTYYKEAISALKKAVEYEQAKIKLQATLALADYEVEVGDRELAKEYYLWLAEEGNRWAKNWHDKDGNIDNELITKSEVYGAEGWFKLAELEYQENDINSAINYYKKISEKHKDTVSYAMAMLRMGEIAETKGSKKDAIEYYNEAINKSEVLNNNLATKTLAYARLKLGSLYIALSQKENNNKEKIKLLQESLKQFEILAALAPEEINLAKIYYYMAEAKYGLELKKEALADYNKALDLDKQKEITELAFLGKAWVLVDLNKNVEAEECLEKIIKNYNNSKVSANALAMLIRIKKENNKYQEVIELASNYLEKYPESKEAPKVWLERAVAYDNIGELKQAAEELAEFPNVFVEHQDIPQALYLRSWVLDDLIKKKKIELENLEKDLDYQQSISGLEVKNLARKKHDLEEEVKINEEEMFKDLEIIAHDYPSYSAVDVIWLRIGELYYDKGEYSKAENYYRKALKIAEENKTDIADKALYRLAWSLQRQSEVAEKELQNADLLENAGSLGKQVWDKRLQAIDSFEKILTNYTNSMLAGDACFRAAELRRVAGQMSKDQKKKSAWLETAAKRYQEAIKKDQQQQNNYLPAAEYGLALTLLLDYKYPTALVSFKNYLDNYPEGYYLQDAYWGIGQASYEVGAEQDAKKAFEKAISINKNNEIAAKSRYGLGMIAYQQKDWQQARIEFMTVDALYSEYPEWVAKALVYAAKAAINAEEIEKARKDLEIILVKYADSDIADEAKDLQVKINLN